jgi:hypothetical protein
MTERIEAQVERFAPGFRDTILARHTMSPARYEGYNANFIGGDIGGGANTLKQFSVSAICAMGSVYDVRIRDCSFARVRRRRAAACMGCVGIGRRGPRCGACLGEKFRDDLAVVDGGAFVAPVVEVGEFFAVQAERVEDGRVDVEDVGFVFDGTAGPMSSVRPTTVPGLMPPPANHMVKPQGLWSRPLPFSLKGVRPNSPPQTTSGAVEAGRGI